jgi:hypothetical protein
MENTFLAKVNKTDTCWEWTGCLDNEGYGRFGQTLTHRKAYQLWKGEIPKGNVIRHLCNNRKCVNPEHLASGTQKDNVADMLRTNPPVWRRGEKNGRAKLTKEDVLEIRQWLDFGYNQKEVANVFNISTTTIHGIHTKKVWGYV